MFYVIGLPQTPEDHGRHHCCSRHHDEKNEYDDSDCNYDDDESVDADDVVMMWWCRPHPVREHAQDLSLPSFSPHTSSSAATPTGSVHKSKTVSVVGMSGQLKRCNESWFGSLQSGQFAAGWLAGSILCR